MERSYNMGKRVHVVPHQDGWAVKREGAERASSVHSTQKEALEAGRPIAEREKTELVTHGTNGKIRDSDSFGSDPHPPIDRKH
jgi:uncharacterized protein YdaT